MTARYHISFVLSQLDDVWCSGVINGRSGIFPRNFVKLSEKTACIPTSVGENNNYRVSARYHSMYQVLLGVRYWHLIISSIHH